MKKLISVLLVVMMLMSLSVSAFAATSSSSQTSDGSGVTGGYVAPTTTDDDEDDDDAAVKEAEAAEAEEAEGLEVADAEGEDADDDSDREGALGEGKDGEGVVVWAGKKTDDGTDEMEDAWDDEVDDLVDAKLALAADEQAAIPAEIAADNEGKTLAAGSPFRIVASEYPVTVTLKVADPEAFAGLMLWDGAKFVKVDCTVDVEAGTVTFVLDGPAVMALVNAIEEAP